MSKRRDIIKAAACLIHEHGYHKVGIKSILDELAIPKGSFYHYFKSKEELGLAIIDYYIVDIQTIIENTESSVQGIYNLFNILIDRLLQMQLKNGCPIGNLILELADDNERFRLKLVKWYKTLEEFITEVLANKGYTQAESKAKALLASFEGVVLLTKLEKSKKHLDVFNKLIFNAVINS